MPLRTLLSLALTGLLAAALLAMGMGTVYLVRHTVDRATQARLRTRLDEGWARRFGPVPPGRSLELTQPPTPATAEEVVRSLADRDTRVRWTDASGTVLAQDGGPPPPPPGRPPERFLTLSRSLVSAGRPVGWLEAAAGMRPFDDLQVALVRTLLLCGAFTLGVGLLVCRALAVRLSRPLERMAGSVARMADGDLSARTGIEPQQAELRTLARALDRMAERLEAAFAARQRFVADASHELKTPLTAVLAMSDLLEHHLEDDPVSRRRAACAIARESARMSRLVEDLLLLARSDGDGREIIRRPVDLRALADEAVEALTAVFPDRSVIVQGEAHLLGEPDALQRVLRNLLENALRYSNEAVRLGLREAGSRIEVEVEDQGVGMSREDLARAFERFHRADPSRQRVTGGVGLGLSIVQAVVKRHGGEIELDSQPGRGTVARVTLPKGEA